MATELPKLINQSVLSYAWGELLLHVLERGTRDLAPVLISVSGFNNNQPAEDGEIRAALDTALVRDGKCTCSDTFKSTHIVLIICKLASRKAQRSSFLSYFAQLPKFS